MRHIVLDTNCLLMSIPKTSNTRIIWESILGGNITLYVTDEIMAEYEEIIGLKTTPEIASHVIFTLLNLNNVVFISTYYKFGLITVDYDDNKFVDCAIAANAEYVVSNDKHFKCLDEIPFPKVRRITCSKFVKLL